LRPFIGLSSQNIGPTKNFWANPVTFTLGGATQVYENDAALLFHFDNPPVIRCAAG
jgi:hypothetical protein